MLEASRLLAFFSKSIWRYEYDPLSRQMRVGVQSGAISNPAVRPSNPLRKKNGITGCGGVGELCESCPLISSLRRWKYLALKATMSKLQFGNTRLRYPGSYCIKHTKG